MRALFCLILPYRNGPRLWGMDSETRAVSIRDRPQTVGFQLPRHLQHQLPPVAVGWSPLPHTDQCGFEITMRTGRRFPYLAAISRRADHLLCGANAKPE